MTLGSLLDSSNCKQNVTAQTGLTASMFCCLASNHPDIGVSYEPFGLGLDC